MSQHHEVLGVPVGASEETIKKAYRKAALACHPDRVQSEEDKKAAHLQLLKVNEAYEALNKGNGGTQGPQNAKAGPERTNPANFSEETRRRFKLMDPQGPTGPLTMVEHPATSSFGLLNIFDDRMGGPYRTLQQIDGCILFRSIHPEKSEALRYSAKDALHGKEELFFKLLSGKEEFDQYITSQNYKSNTFDELANFVNQAVNEINISSQSYAWHLQKNESETRKNENLSQHLQNWEIQRHMGAQALQALKLDMMTAYPKNGQLYLARLESNNFSMQNLSALTRDMERDGKGFFFQGDKKAACKRVAENIERLSGAVQMLGGYIADPTTTLAYFLESSSTNIKYRNRRLEDMLGKDLTDAAINQTQRKADTLRKAQSELTLTIEGPDLSPLDTKRNHPQSMKKLLEANADSFSPDTLAHLIAYCEAGIEGKPQQIHHKGSKQEVAQTGGLSPLLGGNVTKPLKDKAAYHSNRAAFASMKLKESNIKTLLKDTIWLAHIADGYYPTDEYGNYSNSFDPGKAKSNVQKMDTTIQNMETLLKQVKSEPDPKAQKGPKTDFKK